MGGVVLGSVGNVLKKGDDGMFLRTETNVTWPDESQGFRVEQVRIKIL